MRSLLGDVYESFLFSTQHPWVLSEKSFKIMAKSIGIEEYYISYYQRYGLGNLLYWLINKKPGKHAGYNFITRSLDYHWKKSLEEQKKADYIIFKMIKSRKESNEWR